MKIAMTVFKILILGALFIVSNHNLYLSDTNDREVFYDMYSSWVDRLVDQGIELTGYVMKSDWLPKEANNSVEIIDR